ncbi:Caspase recruitment domain-containing protein 14 [Nibea albiflora]|uniref:Caspase recruitment domain-containing protein 14 n=1 Tax=Nibea albiflora TaxID=240163 RepID=A0ACB7FLY3_NIBAL|nr:Caspase recruitment domain-containing protein 14 [Nibea albiflora]
MAEECVPEGPDLGEMGEEELWELINDNRHRISLGVRPCILIPYLRQARVLTEMDEDEILSCHNLTNRSMRTSYMLDLLRTHGRNGAVALLESLMIHYPTLYTQVTGRKPSTEPSRFSGLIKYSELTEYLVRAVTGMQKELQEARCEAGRMTARCSSLESEIREIMGQEEKSRCLQSENERMRRHLCSLQHEVTKLKDEKCDLYMRYTVTMEEKSAVNMRLHDLNLQVYQLQTELQKAQTENEFQKRRSLRCAAYAETPQLQEELRSLRCQLVKAEQLDPARQDILAQDLAEAIDSQVELAEQLRCYREENEKLLTEKQGLSDQKECLSLQVQQLTLDCNMHQQKNTVIQNQMRELQAERDQAYLSRDEAQAMIARVLAEKDTLRCQLVEFQERVFSLQANRSPREQRQSCTEVISCTNTYHCTHKQNSYRAGNVYVFFSKEREVDWDYSRSSSEESTFPTRPASEAKQTPRLSSSNGSSTDGLSRTSAPPFLLRSRPKAIRVNGRVLSISFQAEALLSQLAVIGGNKTGVFVHKVTEGSAAHTVGISPGAQIVEVKYKQNQRALRMVLEDSTLEEAMWALGQITGLCHLSLRPRQDDYEVLLQQLQSSESSSGDSFYVRVNMSLPDGPNGTLAVSCNDIIHVTNTRPASTEDSWHVSQVHPCQLLDLQSGTVPNYYRAQRLLIRAIEDMSFQKKKSQKMWRPVAQNKEKAVRIVSTGRQGRNPLWVSIEDEKTKNTDSEMLNSSEHAALLQRSEILEECEQGRNCCYTLQSVEKVMKKGIHCVLPLGLDCVRRLHRAEIFPIIIFIGQTTRSARKLRSKLQRHGQSEEQLLACSRSEEPLLDKLPCLYHSMAPDSWCDQTSLLTSLRTIIWEEQKKIVWVEPDLW